MITGGPGSGKGTQCTRIVEEFGYIHLSAGDLLRQEVAKENERGQMIKDIMKEGKLVPQVKMKQCTVNSLFNNLFFLFNNKFEVALKRKQCLEIIIPTNFFIMS